MFLSTLFQWSEKSTGILVNTPEIDGDPNSICSPAYQRITDDDLGAGGQKAKYQYNVDAIRTLKQVEAENRLATPEEQEILSRYVGWGGICDMV